MARIDYQLNRNKPPPIQTPPIVALNKSICCVDLSPSGKKSPYVLAWFGVGWFFHESKALKHEFCFWRDTPGTLVLVRASLPKTLLNPPVLGSAGGMHPLPYPPWFFGDLDDCLSPRFCFGDTESDILGTCPHSTRTSYCCDA